MNKLIYKKAAIGESIQNVYRLVVIMAIAFIILGTSAIVLGVYINVRDGEARILANQVFDCLNNDGVINLDQIKISDRNKILDYCGINNTARFYVRVDFSESGKSFLVLQHGDSSKMVVKTIFDNNNYNKRLEIYKPGYMGMPEFNYPVLFNNNLRVVNVKMEVLVLDEESV